MQTTDPPRDYTSVWITWVVLAIVVAGAIVLGLVIS